MPNVQHHERHQMQHHRVSCQHQHIVATIHIFDFIEFQHILARWELRRVERLSVEFGHHEGSPGVRVERDVMRPFQPIRKVGWDDHEALEQHEESEQSGQHRHADHEMGDDVRYQLRQCLRCQQRQEHVQEVPERIVEVEHRQYDHRDEQRQQSRAGDGGQPLCRLVGDGMIILVQNFLVDDVALHDRERKHRHAHEDEEGDAVERNGGSGQDALVVIAVSQIPEQRPHHQCEHGVHGDSREEDARVEPEVEKVPVREFDHNGDTTRTIGLHLLLVNHLTQAEVAL
mmetsp:Transcript_26965/g.75833  ORF Transcript_26965/g.75833 Transcript_26965/m.75833 type:complete len:286 (-) Transcript_26965:700-1557(-)